MLMGGAQGLSFHVMFVVYCSGHGCFAFLNQENISEPEWSVIKSEGKKPIVTRYDKMR